MSLIILRPAALVKRGSLILYSTSLKVSDLLIPNFYSVEKIDSDVENDKGSQRLLNRARTKRLRQHLVEIDRSGLLREFCCSQNFHSPSCHWWKNRQLPN